MTTRNLDANNSRASVFVYPFALWMLAASWLIPAAAFAQTSASKSGDPTTKPVLLKARGFVEEEFRVPTTDDASEKKQTPLEKRDNKRKLRQAVPQPTYNPYIDKVPPSQEGAAPPPVGPPLPGTLGEEGPGPTNDGQSENVSPTNQVVGACNSVATNPANADIIYAGFTNGGIWKTTNATNASPTWAPQTDALGSLSIGSIEMDPTDATSNTLVAGVGRTSSLAGLGGSNIGLLRTTDGGANWSVVGGATLVGKGISGVAARGSVIVVAVSAADSFTYSNIGIFRSTDTGASFTRISSSSPSTATNGLYGGRAFDLASDPTNNAILYTVIRDATINNGIYKSVDTGANWTRVSDATINSVLTDSSPSTSKVELAVGNANNVYAAIVRSGRLSHVFRSGNGGGTWAAMDLPGTTEGGNFYGIHVGGQGSIHLSIAADPSNAQVVYIGGDRQPAADELVTPAFPNSIGAVNYSGRLFRGNASLAPGSQWTPLTHVGTASNSSPHADSRDMAFDANGRLIEADDAGVYARTSPANATGNWFALQGSLRATEVHDIAYDAISNKIVVGTQDTGTAFQQSSGTWGSVSTGDGGDVAVDDVSQAGSNISVRYTSFQNLGALRRRTYNAAGGLLTDNACPLTVLSGGPAIVPQFYTPIEVNKVAPTRLLIAASNGLYESLDQGATCTYLTSAWAGDGLSGVGISYGGTSGADNADVIYAVDGATVYVRTTPGTTFASTVVATGGNVLLDVVSKRDDYNTAYAVTKANVYRTVNTGASFTDITGDLTGVGDIRCVEFIPTPNGGTVAVGTQTGVYVAKATAPTAWQRLGTNMPTAAYVFDLAYNATDDVLVAGTLGRSVWKLNNASTGANVPVGLVKWEVF